LPAAANFLAMAFPNPELAPVTSIFLCIVYLIKVD
jgi:hypothetical protein